MNLIIRDLTSTEKFQNFLKKISKNESQIELSGLVCVAKSQIVLATQEQKRQTILLITYNELEGRRLVEDLSYFIDDVYFMPKRDVTLYDFDAESNDTKVERINVLNNIYMKKAKIVVTTIETIMQKMIPFEKLYERSINLKVGDNIKLEELKKLLIDFGYERIGLVDNLGQFSNRGNIVDISINKDEGARIEFWGDEIDSIRKFKVITQRSMETLDNYTILPSTEFVLTSSRETISKRIEDLIYIKGEKYKKLNLQETQVQEDIEIIKNGDYEIKIDKYFNEFYEGTSSLLDYMKDSLIFTDEKTKIEERINSIKEDNKNIVQELIEKEKQIPEIIYDIIEYKDLLKNYINLSEEDKIKTSEEEENHFNFREVNLYKDESEIFKKSIQEQLKNGKRIIILSGNKENQDKICKMIDINNKLDDLSNLILKKGQLVVSTGFISSGFENKDTGLIVITSDEFINKTIRRKRYIQNESFKNGEKVVFADLKPGDLVVHKNYGIGRFLSIRTISNDGITKDYIELGYKDDDTLFVPTDGLDNVRKYIGGAEGIRLNKLGTKDWKEAKEKVKGNLKLIAKNLVELYAIRENSKGFAFSKDTPWQNQFELGFPYQETDDQLRCISEVKKDMESQKPMDRLLCGDVGYGKTEVAIRAAFKAVMDQKQVCYLAPTTILANQQYNEFKDRMKEYPIKVELLNRFRTVKQQKEIIKRLKSGDIDIVIGTHRLLSNDIEFFDLGLLIIDEEHRFGVKAKEKIKQYKKNIDVLTMTATPIPRTLQMSIVGIRDMSVIYEPPQDRKPIQTYVLEYDKEIVKEAITKELERNGQVYYIYNITENMVSKKREIESLVPEAKVGFANGKMSGNEIEEIMQDFIDKKINVLVCTTILESGIDIPNANTIIIENADRFRPCTTLSN